MRDFFCVCFLNDRTGERKLFEISFRHNNCEQLKLFLQKNVKGLKGYNNVHYDSQLIQYIQNSKLTITADELYKFSQKIIDAEFPPYPSWKLNIPNLDIFKILHLDNKNRRVGLKWCEYMIDWHNIEDMPHHHESLVQSDEIADEIISYCWNDVLATNELFIKYNKEVELRKDITRKYGINLMNASNSRIGSELLLKLYCNSTNRDIREVRKLKTHRSNIAVKDILFPYIKFKTVEFNNVLDYFKQLVINSGDKIDAATTIKGIDYVYGLGGIHASISNKIVIAEDDELIIDCDVSSLYPSIAIVNKLYPEHLGYEFSEVYDKDVVAVRLSEKAKKEKGDKAIVDGFKEVANATYGKSNEESSWLYDPKYTFTTTINGQLMLSMLAERLMNIGDIIQVNTDGITVKIKKNKEQEYYQICKEWEKTTQLTLEYAQYSKMMIRDVNSYIAIYTNGKAKCKGTFEFENFPLHKNKSENIVAIAIYQWFVNNIDIEETIRNHKNILDFCIGVRTKSDSKFIYLDKNAKEYSLPKTLRYFISNKGVVIKKRFHDGRTHYLNVHPQKGKTFYQTMLNQYEVTNAHSYDVNYSYYIFKTKEELHNIVTNQTTII